MADEPEKTPVTYTEEQFTAKLNEVLAKDRRKHEAAVKEAKAEAQKQSEAFQQMRQQVESMLEGKSFDDIRAELEDSANKLRSAEEQSKIERSKYDKALATTKAEAEQFKSKYLDTVISRALADAATPKASAPGSTNLIATAIKQKGSVSVDDAGNVFVEMQVVEEGVTTKKKLKPEEAVALLESDTAYAPLFAKHITGGVGGSQSQKSAVDVTNMTMDQYIAARKANPRFLETV